MGTGGRFPAKKGVQVSILIINVIIDIYNIHTMLWHEIIQLQKKVIFIIHPRVKLKHEQFDIAIWDFRNVDHNSSF